MKSLHGKPYFYFPDVLKRLPFKKNALKYDLSCIIGKNDIFRQKMKVDLSRKKYMKIWYFLQMFWKDGLFKKIYLEYDITCIIWKGGLFPRKNDIFSLDGKWKMILLKKCMAIWYFLYIRIAVSNMISCPSAKKKSKIILQKKSKLHLKVIDILDWHSRKSSNNSLYFYGDLYKCSYIAFQKKKQET